MGLSTTDKRPFPRHREWKEALLTKTGEIRPPSAETSHLRVATKAADTQEMLGVSSQGWMKHPVSRVG